MADFVAGRRIDGQLGDYVPGELWGVVRKHGHQKALPLIARTPELSAMAEHAVRSVPSEHRVYLALCESAQGLEVKRLG